MRPAVANRKIHYWLSFVFALPVIVMIASGLLLQVKKQSGWVQPPAQRGKCEAPSLSFDHMIERLRHEEELRVTGWKSVDRVDVRPDLCLAKVQLKSGFEVQMDLASGEVLQTAYRRSDLIESIHDGSFFAGDWSKVGLFLPAGAALLLPWLIGLWMFYQPFAARRRQRKRLQQGDAVIQKPAA